MGALEAALHQVDPDDVQAWSRRWFTRDNAVAWLSAEPPADFKLPLPSGERLLPEPIRDIPSLPLPCWASVDVGGVILGSPVERTSATAVGMSILSSRAERRLRRELGLAYQVSGSYIPLGPTTAHAAIYLSARASDAAKVAGEFVALAEHLASKGPEVEELAEDLDRYERSGEDPRVLLGQLARAAENELFGFPQDTWESLMKERRALHPADVAAAVEAFLARAIGLGAGLPYLPPRWRPYPMWSDITLTGQTFDHVSKKHPWTKDTERMVLSGEGLTWHDTQGRPITIRFATTCLYLRGLHGERTLVGDDGFRLLVKPDQWKGSAELIRRLDERVPPAVVVTLRD